MTLKNGLPPPHSISMTTKPLRPSNRRPWKWPASGYTTKGIVCCKRQAKTCLVALTRINLYYKLNKNRHRNLDNRHKIWVSIKLDSERCSGITYTLMCHDFGCPCNKLLSLFCNWILTAPSQNFSRTLLVWWPQVGAMKRRLPAVRCSKGGILQRLENKSCNWQNKDNESNAIFSSSKWMFLIHSILLSKINWKKFIKISN